MSGATNDDAPCQKKQAHVGQQRRHLEKTPDMTHDRGMCTRDHRNDEHQKRKVQVCLSSSSSSHERQTLNREKYCKGRTVFVHLVAVCVAMQLAVNRLVLLPEEKPFCHASKQPQFR